MSIRRVVTYSRGAGYREPARWGGLLPATKDHTPMTTIAHTLATGTTVLTLLAAPQAATAAPAAEMVELGAPLAQAQGLSQ